MAKILLVAKYSFFVVMVMSAGVVIERISGITRWSESERLIEEDLTYNASAPLALGFVDPDLNKDYMKCISAPSKPFCLLSADKRLELFRSESSVESVERKLHNITSKLHEHGHHAYLLFVAFTRLMESFDVKTILIEPSMLYCLLSYTETENMLLRGFNPDRIRGSRDVITFAVFENDSQKLQEENVTSAALSAGFTITKVKNLTKSWTSMEDETEEHFEITHYFFMRQKMAVHVVVFYRRNSYFWHSGMNSEGIAYKDLLFVDDQVFENFTSLSLNLNGMLVNQTFIPSDVRYFLGEVESSNFSRCRVESHSVAPVQQHSFLTHEKLKTRAAIALRELKMVLAPQMVIFWLWFKTLLGWFDNCNILHYSTVLQLSLTSNSIRGLNFPQLFADNEFLKVQNNNNITDSEFEYHLDCRGLLIKIYVMHKQRGTLWYKYTDGQDVYRLAYPTFKLCSTDIFGHKANVPCNYNILSSEDKQNWTDTDVLSPIVE